MKEPSKATERDNSAAVAAAAAAAAAAATGDNNPKSKIWSEARKEFLPLTFATISLIISSSVNQSIPRLMGVLMDPSKTTSSSVTTEKKFVSQIIFLSIAGGASSFLRVSFTNKLFIYYETFSFNFLFFNNVYSILSK